MGDWYTKVKAEFILNFVEDNRWKYLVTGLGNTLKITLAAVLLGIVIGTLVAIVRSTWDQNAERMRPGAGKSLPALANEFIVLLKETSVAGYVAVTDLTKGGDIIRGRTFSAFMPLIVVALIYLVMVMFFTWLVGKLERRLRSSDH